MSEVVRTTQTPTLDTERVQCYVLADQHPQIDDIQMIGGDWGNVSSLYSYVGISDRIRNRDRSHGLP